MKQSRTRQRLLSFVAAVALAVTGLAPTVALAEGAVAEYRGVKYDTLQAAVDAAGRTQSDVITLLQDTTENVTVTEYKKFTLDLNGKTLSGGTDYDAAGNQTEHFNKAALTLDKDGANVIVTDTVGGGVIKRDDPGAGSGLGSNDGSYYVVHVINGTLKLAGGTVKNESGKNGSSAVCVGGDGAKSPVLNIAGATVVQDSFIAAKCDEKGTLYVTGGEVKSANESAIQNWNKTIVKGGEVDGLIWTMTYEKTWGQTSIQDSAVVNGELRAEKYDSSATRTPTYNVSGGTLDVAWNIKDSGDASVTGGKFAQAVPEQFIKDGYMLGEKGADGYYGIEKFAVARIGDTDYATLAEAIKASQPGDTIKLVHDTEESGLSLGAGKDIVLDLNGYTLSSTSDAGITVSAGKLVVKDSKAAQPTVDGATVSGYAGGRISAKMVGVRVWDGGQFELQSGMVESAEDLGIYVQGNINGDGMTASTATISGGYVKAQEHAVSPQGNGATVIVSGGVLESMDNAVIGGNGSAKRGGTSVTVSGGTLVGRIQSAGSIACGIYQPQDGTLDITGGTIIADAGAGVVARAGKVTITGGTIRATGTATGKVGDANVEIPSSAVVIDGSANYPDASEDFGAVISGGTMTSENGEALVAIRNDADDKGTVSVSGGSFSNKVPEDMAAEGLEPTEKNEDGTYTVAKQYEVTFKANNGSQDTVVKVFDGKTVAKPSDPSKAGFAFAGWFADEALTSAYDFDAPVTGDVTLYAKWAAVHKVTFVYGTGADDLVVEVIDGQAVTKPADPTYEGWNFEGWFLVKNADGTLDVDSEYDFATPVKADMKIYAGWTEVKPADDGNTTNPEQPKPADGKAACRRHAQDGRRHQQRALGHRRGRRRGPARRGRCPGQASRALSTSRL